MIFIYYEHINNDLDKTIQELAERIKGEGIAVHIGCEIPEKSDHIIVLVESIWRYIEESQANPEFEKVLYGIKEKPHKIICVSYQKCEDFRNVSYVKKRDVFFLMKDYNKLLKNIKTVRALENAGMLMKKIFTVKNVVLAGISSIIIAILTITSDFILKEPDIPKPQLEIKWEYLSAYDYNYIIKLNDRNVVKKEKNLIKELIKLNKDENVIVGTIVIKNKKNEYPEHMRVNLERIQDGQVSEDEINLKTVSHNDYIMIPLFITEKFPENFADNIIPSSITKKEIFDAIDTRVVYNPVSIQYEKARFWDWNKDEIITIEESSDVLTEWEILIEVTEGNWKEEVVTGKEESEETLVSTPRIYKSKIVGQ